MKKATKDLWKTLPLPDEISILHFDKEFTDEEYVKIANGLIPREMEDKWFIYLEDNTLHMHRSWTGHCIYQIAFEKENDKYIIKEVKVNRNKEQYKQDNEYDIKLLDFLISDLLLGKNTPFPKPKEIKE
jgi:hypothetical protein